MPPEEDPAQDIWLDEEAGPVVRPYAMTRGRTRPTRGEFDLISIVVATKPAASVEYGLPPEHTAILSLCQTPLSVAEVAARVDLPVGIVRVFLGDLLDKELIAVREPRAANELPIDQVYEAVIDGLRAL
jgi:Protein of unknown function (DUF742)